MADVAGKVCVNHPEVDAASRCVACFKPICGECTITDGGEDFCSEGCKSNHQRTDAAVGAMLKADARRARAAMIKKLIILVIILAAAAFGGKYYMDNKDELDKKAKDLKEQAEQKAKEAQDAAKEAAPK